MPSPCPPPSCRRATSAGRGSASEGALVADLLKLLLKIRARESNVAPRLVAKAEELELLAAGRREGLAILEGWRFEEFGRDALDLVEGRLAFADPRRQAQHDAHRAKDAAERLAGGEQLRLQPERRRENLMAPLDRLAVEHPLVRRDGERQRRLSAAEGPCSERLGSAAGKPLPEPQRQAPAARPARDRSGPQMSSSQSSGAPPPKLT